MARRGMSAHAFSAVERRVGRVTDEVASGVVAQQAAAPRAPALRVIVLPCLVSFIAWEGARFLLSLAPDIGAVKPVMWSLVRAILLLLPAALVTRRILGEPLAQGFWLGSPARQGLFRSCFIGAAYLLLINGLDFVLNGTAPSLPSLSAVALALTLFDAAVEEALFRGFLLQHLLPGRRFARANVLAAFIFLLPHARKIGGFWQMGMRFELVVIALSIFVLGLALGAAARPVRSIWITTLVHALANLLASD
jgi:membrane protease YdiL (CAAX protease family)